MDACACIVGLLEELVQICGQTRQVVAVRVEEAADAGHAYVIFGGLEDEVCGGCCSFADAAGIAVAHCGNGRMCSMPAVHINRTVINNCAKTGIGCTRPVENGRNAAGRNVSMAVVGCTATQASIGNGNRLGGAVVAVGMCHCAANDHACPNFVVGFKKLEIFHPGNVFNGGNGVHLCAVGGNDQVTAVLFEQSSAAGLNGRCCCGGIPQLVNRDTVKLNVASQ